MRDEVAAAIAKRDFLFANFEEVDGPLETPCLEWQRNRHQPRGYGYITFRRKSYLAHRLSWIIHHGPIPDGLCCLHRCDNPPCVSPEHLFIGTMRDNAQDMIAKGRKAPTSGELHGQAVLSEADVANVKGLLCGKPCRGLQAELAQRYGITTQTIYDIAIGEEASRMTDFNNRSTQREKAEVLRNDTYFHRAQVDQELGGRFAKASVVAGEAPSVQYPRLPSSSPWSEDPVPPEEPLSVDVNAQEPTGTPAEIEASLAMAPSSPCDGAGAEATGPASAPCAVVEPASALFRRRP